MKVGCYIILALGLLATRAMGLLGLSREPAGRFLKTNLKALSPLQQDLAVSALSVGGTIVWLQIWIGLAKRGVIESKLSRKIIHTGSAPLFMFLWPLFSSSPNAKYFAAGVVVLQMTRLVVAGSLKAGMSGDKVGLVASNSQDLVNAISRSGASKEALGGPLIYTIVLLLSTLLCFRENPAGVVAVTQMAAGDGMADIIGRRFGTTKWPFAKDKSIEGSLAFVFFAFVVTSGILALYHATGFLDLDVSVKWPIVLAISVLCAVVEVLPVGEDNITVPLAAAGLSAVLLRTV